MAVRVRGQWRYLYRTVDKVGQTIDFVLTEPWDEQAAIRRYNDEYGTAVAVR
jgi:transposase-like protein